MNRNGDTRQRCRSWKNCNNPTTHIIKYTSGWGFSPWEYARSWRWYSFHNVSINDNGIDEFSEGVSNERQVKRNLGTRRKVNFQDEALHLQNMKIKLMEERLIKKKSKADEDEGYMFLMSLLLSLKKLDEIQGRELGIEFLSSVTRRIRISKNLYCLLIVFPQHLTSCRQLHLRVQQVSMQHILWIQTLQRIHRRCSLSQAQIYCNVSFRFSSENF